MRCVVTGSGGQLGQCLARRLEAAPDHDLLYAPDHAALDLSRADDIDALFDPGRGEGADVLFNAAAYTAVDRCEREEELALAINGEAPGALAARCRDAGVRFVHVSTDYVFDGRASRPYLESDEPSPLNAYGRTKLAGERAVSQVDSGALIVRTSWVFGPGRNFVAAIVEQARKRRSGEAEGPLAVVDDQTGSPTFADHLARGLVSLVELEAAPGITHLCAEGETTWWGFACAILERVGAGDLDVDRLATRDLDLAAERPRHSVLDTSRAAKQGVRLPSWQEGLDAYLASPDGAALRASATAAKAGS